MSISSDFLYTLTTNISGMKQDIDNRKKRCKPQSLPRLTFGKIYSANGKNKALVWTRPKSTRRAAITVQYRTAIYLSSEQISS